MIASRVRSRNPFINMESHVVDLTKIEGFSEDLDLIDSYDSYLRFRSDCPVIFSSIVFLPYITELLTIGEFGFVYLFFLKAIRDFEMLKLADGIIVESTSQQRYLSTHGVTKPCFVIPPYYDDEKLSPTRIASHPIESRSKTIAYVGRIHRLKGVFDLIDAIASLKAQMSEWRLVMIGDGPHLQAAKAKTARAGLDSTILFTGRLSESEVYSMLSDSQVFVLPSYIENVPSSLIQAMAAGCACISTDVGGIKGDIVEDGVDGVLIPRRSVRALAESIHRLITNEDLRETLAMNARVKCEHLSKTSFVKKTIDSYLRVAMKLNSLAREVAP